MPITDKHYEYAKKLSDEMFKLGLRVYLDDRNEKIGYKIREAQLQKFRICLLSVIKKLKTVQLLCAAAAKEISEL